MFMDSKKSTENKQKKPRIVEIVGPAGAGKTTLCKLLSLTHGFRLSSFPDVRKAANAPFFILYGLRLTPILARVSQFDDRWLSRREFAWLTILSGWPMILQKELKKNDDIILLDQGPFYLLSEMDEFGPACLKRGRAEQVWQMLYRQWAATLDAIVWLDAADEDLLRRIRDREKEHIVKAESAQMAFEFLRHSRNAYMHTLSRLTVNRKDLKVFWFDTTQHSPEVIMNRLLAEFNLKVVSSPTAND